MGRNNSDFKGQILYHGSPTTIPIGGMVTPRNGEAFATTRLSTAKANAHGLFGTQKGTIHEVEALKDDDTLTPARKKSGELRSSKGFRVVRHLK
jgi:hypothetical protein